VRQTNTLIKKTDLVVLTLVFLLIASFIELSYGSLYLGIGFLVFTVFFLYMFLKEREVAKFKPSLLKLIIGTTSILIVIEYNIYKNSTIQTFDSMIILLGFSLIISNIRGFAEIGKFATYFSSIFLVLFISLFIVPEKIGIDLPYYYGHYFVTLPVVVFMKQLGINVDTHGMRLIEVNGVEHAILKVDLACFGWYSILLIVSLVLSYSITIEKIQRKRLVKILLVLLIASYLANLLRVAILVYMAYYYGLDVMMVAHSHLGWILFAVILLPIAFLLLGSNRKKG